MRKRIWELDAFRGLCVLGMVIVHFMFDLVELYGLIRWEYPPFFSFVKDWGGVLFLLLSGTCATLGRHSVRRGILVFLCGLICSGVTAGMYLLGYSGREIIIWFGVLHCLGLCMILWAPLKKLPTWALGILGIGMVAAGMVLQSLTTQIPWLFPLGLTTPVFASSDYFPLLPYLGFFLLGAVIGRTAYRQQRSLLPRVNENNLILRFFRFCGRQSLWIYLLHQPVLALICEILWLL